MGDIILFIFSILCSGIFGGAIYLFLSKGGVKNSFLTSLLLSGLMCALIFWVLSSAVPKQNAKKRILYYTKNDYPIEHQHITIVERSPEEGEILAFSDNETGAIAFKLSKPIELRVREM